MFTYTCICGAEYEAQDRALRRFASCDSCGGVIVAVASGAGGKFNSRLVGLNGRIRGIQIILGGVEPITVGKRPDRHLILPGSLVSRDHCRLVPTGDGWQLVDARSKNGSIVNGTKVRIQKLHPGDIVQFGEYEFEFRNGATGTVPVPSPEAAKDAGKSANRSNRSLASVDFGDSGISDDLAALLAPSGGA